MSNCKSEPPSASETCGHVSVSAVAKQMTLQSLCRSQVLIHLCAHIGGLCSLYPETCSSENGIPLNDGRLFVNTP